MDIARRRSNEKEEAVGSQGGGLKNNFFLELTLSQKQSGLERKGS